MGRTGRIQAVACTYFRGYEDVAVHTVLERRRHHITLTCVTALCADITVGAHTPSRSCSLHNRASRFLAWNAGFRLVREHVHHAAGSPASQDRLSA